MTTAKRRPESKLGRKRDKSRTLAILDAAMDLLNEIGYDHIRIQDIADRAGASVATIYRRWETKEAVITEAIRASADLPIEHSDDPDADLEAVIRAQAVYYGDHPDLFPGLIAATRNDPELAQAVRDSITHNIIEPITTHISRLHPGIDPATATLHAEIVPALLLHRVAITSQPFDPDSFTAEMRNLINRATP